MFDPKLLNPRPYVSNAHFDLVADTKRLLAYNPDADFAAQKQKVSDKLTELMGIPEKRTDPKPIIDYISDVNPEFDEIRFRFESEPGFFMPAHMLLPKGVWKSGKAKLSTIICIQGHANGMHISIGRPKYPGDAEDIAGDRDFAVQAVRQGYAAVALEQRGFGELSGALDRPVSCHTPAVQAMMLGRTLIGERASDVSRLIDALEHFDECDTTRVGLMGNSGGGTATFYTACVEPRIKVAMPSCAFCGLYDSIFAQHHCICNYIPRMFQYFDMGDLAILIAPRPIVVICGAKDRDFPMSSTKREFATVEKIYAAAGAPDRCRLVVGPEGHRFYADLGWPVFNEMFAKL